ncbi:T9SS type A sorting domain-containing protein [Wenyingzhuangia sp. IMCC45574]
MKSRILIHTIAFLFFGFLVKAQGKVNTLSSEYYGFEVASGDDGWWMQQPENWSIATDKGASGTSRSLKYTNDASFTGSKKAFGSSSISDMLIDLAPGSYELKAMIWVESSSTSISRIRANFRTAGKSEVNVNFDVATIAKDQWVEVRVPFTITESFENTNVRIMMDSSTGGIGTFYFDELQLLIDPIALPVAVPFTSQINSTEDKNITLPAGNYEVALQIWVEGGTTIPSFYTQIIEPWNSIKWELDGVATEQWVELRKEIVIAENVNDSKFQIFVSNFSDGEIYTGGFYVDDIEFTLTSVLSNPDFDIKVIGETCQDKNDGKLEISTETVGAYYVEFNGSKIDFTETTTIENLNPDTYHLKIGSNYTSTETEYILVLPEATKIEASLSPKTHATLIHVDKGTAPFLVYKNGEKIKEFDENIFEVESELGDLIEVETAVPCEGKLSNFDEMALVYPNPAEGYFNVFCPAGSRVRIFSTTGQLVQEIEIKKTNPRIELGEEIRGVFYVEVLIGSKSVVKKLVVK